MARDQVPERCSGRVREHALERQAVDDVAQTAAHVAKLALEVAHPSGPHASRLEAVEVLPAVVDLAEERLDRALPGAAALDRAHAASRKGATSGAGASLAA